MMATSSTATDAAASTDADDCIVDVSKLSLAVTGVPVISNAELTLSKGQRCVLIGLNGSGKSCLIRTMAGMHIADFDRLRIADRHGASIQDQCFGLAYLGESWTRSVAFA